MKDRPAYNLKKTIMLYNLLQVLFSGYVFYEAGMAGWWTGYNWLCQDIDRAADPDSKGKLLKFILRPLKFIPPTLFVSLWHSFFYLSFKWVSIFISKLDNLFLFSYVPKTKIDMSGATF